MPSQRQIILGVLGLMTACTIVALEALVAGQNYPEMLPVAIAAAVLLALLMVAYWLGWEPARYCAVVGVTLLVAFGIQEPFVTAEFSQTVILAPILALILAGPAWVVGSAVVIYGVLLLRAGGVGTYADPFSIVLMCMAVGGLILSRLMTDGARRTALENENRALRQAERAEQALAQVENQTHDLARQSAAIRFQAGLLDVVEQGVIATDLGGTIIYWNRYAQTLTGWSAAEALGRQLLDLVPVWLETGEAPPLERGLAGEILTGEVVIERRGGATVPALVATSPIYDDHGGLIGIVCVATDLTARKAEEQERAAIERRMMEAQKLESLGMLAGGIAHDFNNMLVSVLGYANLAMSDLEEDSPARESIERIDMAARRAADLTRQILAYAGRGRFLVQTIDLNQLVEEMAGLLKASIPKQILCDQRLSGGALAIEADATQIRQILMNLVINATEAIGEASGTITVATSRGYYDREALAGATLGADAAEGEYVALEVSDTGSGMDEVTLRRVFDPFFTTKVNGRGLGLAAVQGIVRAHRAALFVASRPDRGTTFRVVFPAVGAYVELPAELDRLPAELDEAGTVLVVDDEEGVCDVARRMLERSGHFVLTATDGAAGLELLERCGDEIGVVLLDMTMPGLTGAETFHEMQRVQPGVPIVMMSGYNVQEIDRRLSDSGLAGFLHKPFTAAALINAVATALAGRSSQPGPPATSAGS